MRLTFLLFLFLTPFERVFTTSGTHIQAQKIYSFGTHLHLYEGSGFEVKGNYISMLTADNSLWIYCLSGSSCLLHAGLEDRPIELDAVGGSLQLSQLSELDLRLRWASADITGFDRLTLKGYHAPSVLKPNPMANLRVSQQGADVMLVTQDQHWSIQAQATEILGRQPFDVDSLDSGYGTARVQVNQGRFLIPEVLVSREYTQ